MINIGDMTRNKEKEHSYKLIKQSIIIIIKKVYRWSSGQLIIVVLNNIIKKRREKQVIKNSIHKNKYLEWERINFNFNRAWTLNLYGERERGISVNSRFWSFRSEMNSS